MIRVNVLGGGQAPAKKRASFQTSHKLTIACSLILLSTAALIGWRHLSIGQQSAQLDADIFASQQEAARLRAIISQVQQFEQRKAQLQQRVGLIEQLRRDQIGPVHMLDQISLALPPMLWLTEVKQATTSANEVLIDGRCTSLTGLTDFVANLETSGYFQRSVEIVSSTTETATPTAGELIKFQIKAVFQLPPAPKAGGTGGGAVALPKEPTSRG